MCRRGTQDSLAESGIRKNWLFDTNLPHKKRFSSEPTRSFSDSLGVRIEDPDQLVAMNQDNPTERKTTLHPEISLDLSF